MAFDKPTQEMIENGARAMALDSDLDWSAMPDEMDARQNPRTARRWWRTNAEACLTAALRCERTDPNAVARRELEALKRIRDHLAQHICKGDRHDQLAFYIAVDALAPPEASANAPGGVFDDNA